MADQRIVSIKLAYLGQGETLDERNIGQEAARKWGINSLLTASLPEALAWLDDSGTSFLRGSERWRGQA